MQHYWHYLYVIIYPELGYKLYYGSRITTKHPDEDSMYFGSSRTFARYNNPDHSEYQAGAIKVVLVAEHRRRNKTNERWLSEQEMQLIKTAHKDHGLEICLNRNVSGRFILTPDELKAAGKKAVALGYGLTGMSPDDRLAAQKRGGAAAARKMAKTYKMLSPDNKRKTIHNMSAFCREHSLLASHMFEVANGIMKSYKGWRKQ
jgi:NADPH-dependent glutamate synthase beta subunit-like oxidoreductase